MYSKLTIPRDAKTAQRGIVEKMFHHEHHHKDGKQQDAQIQAQGQEPEKEESEMRTFTDYMKEDEKLEQEG